MAKMLKRERITVTLKDLVKIRRFRTIQRRRGDKLPSRTILALAEERLYQIEQHGDPAAIAGPGTAATQNDVSALAASGA